MKVAVWFVAALLCVGSWSSASAHICDQSWPAVVDSKEPDARALGYACTKRAQYRGSIIRDDVLVVADFRYRSGYPRFFIVDPKTGRIVSRHRTSEGMERNATGAFCNTLFGAYVTQNAGVESNGEPYVPLQGLDNPESELRGIRVAGRPYAPAPSCGSFMVVTSRIRVVAERIQGGALLVAVPPAP